MPKFIRTYSIVSATGQQVWQVEASDIDEANELFDDGKGEVIHEEVDIQVGEFEDDTQEVSE